jgi:hypothetical protein
VTGTVDGFKALDGCGSALSGGSREWTDTSRFISAARASSRVD